MKNLFFKFTLLLIIAVASFTNIYALTDDNPNHYLSEEEIAIRAATNPVDPDFERTIINPVRAFLYRADGVIELIFQIVLGNTRVEIVDEFGMVVSEHELSLSIYNPTTIISAPGFSGDYTINIYANSYHGIGDFTIY